MSYEQENIIKIIKIMSEKNLNYIYHLTKLSNLGSIIKTNGLYSYNELISENIVSNYSTNDLSKELDKKKNLTDYVRFSFTTNSPLFKKFLKSFNNENFLLFKVDIQKLTTFFGLKFSNINATDNNSIIFDDIDNFNNLDFEAFLSDEEIVFGHKSFKTVQAEILIPKYMPLAFLEIDCIIIQKGSFE